jgi:hypothetical protein
MQLGNTYLSGHNANLVHPFVMHGYICLLVSPATAIFGRFAGMNGPLLHRNAEFPAFARRSGLDTVNLTQYDRKSADLSDSDRHSAGGGIGDCSARKALQCVDKFGNPGLQTLTIQPPSHLAPQRRFRRPSGSGNRRQNTRSRQPYGCSITL